MSEKSIWKFIFEKESPEKQLDNIIKKIEIFESLTFWELKVIKELLFRRKYSNNEVIFKKGDPGVGMYIITRGDVSIVLSNNEGSEIEVARLCTGQFFGEVSLADGSDRTATAKAIGETEVLGFFRMELFKLIDTKPKIASKILLKIAEVLGGRLRYSNLEKVKGEVTKS